MIVLRHLNRCLYRTMFQPKPFIRTVSTSKKNSETISVHTDTKTESKNEEKGVTNTHHWRTYGFDYVNEQRDIFWAHVLNFGIVFFIFAGPIFGFMYYPDAMDIEWSQREAFIQIRRHEVLGLPIVDPNYVDPETIELPPDETLGDDDIII